MPKPTSLREALAGRVDRVRQSRGSRPRPARRIGDGIGSTGDRARGTGPEADHPGAPA